jgi:hypothetical protein
MTEFAEQLRRLRLVPPAALPDDEFVTRVMLACRTTPLHRAAPIKRVKLYGLVALAAGISLTVGALSLRPAPPAPERFTARGVTSSSPAVTVQAFVGRSDGGAPPALLEGAALRAGDGVLVRYSNPGVHEAFLMVFAIDQRGTVHWLHPAYLDERTDPQSLRLAVGVTERVLPEIAEPEEPAPGELRVYALLTLEPLAVHAVEQRLNGAAVNVPALFPEAEVESWRCTWLAR